MMDPLFDDWLHEHNLDVLFDLFEEEIESKVCVEPAGGSFALFGTSPTLASTLDLLYLENQQLAIEEATLEQAHYQQQQHQLQQQQQQQQQLAAAANGVAAVTAAAVKAPSNLNTSATTSNSTFDSNRSTSPTFIVKKGGARHVGPTLHAGTNSSVTNSITNAMRIKRGLKRGQSEGISLLAKPFAANYSRQSRQQQHKPQRQHQHKQHHQHRQPKVQQQPKRETIYLHNCQHHIHQITGRAVIHEHSYAVRGH